MMHEFSTHCVVCGPARYPISLLYALYIYKAQLTHSTPIHATSLHNSCTQPLAMPALTPSGIFPHPHLFPPCIPSSCSLLPLCTASSSADIWLLWLTHSCPHCAIRDCFLHCAWPDQVRAFLPCARHLWLVHPLLCRVRPLASRGTQGQASSHMAANILQHSTGSALAADTKLMPAVVYARDCFLPI